MSAYIFGITIGYLIGSFPTAYVLVKRRARLDIRGEGSGNVGAMNAFDVTRSKKLGIVIFLIDMAKGFVVVWLCALVTNTNAMVMGLGGVTSMLGHNYPIWLKFQGGRGLSTAVGVMLMLGWIFILTWCLLWCLGYVAFKNIHVRNILATLFSVPLLVLMPRDLVIQTLPKYVTPYDFFFLSILISVVILIRHREPILELWKSFFHQSS